MAVCDKVYKAVDFDVILIFRHPNSYNSCSPANPSVVVLTYTVGHLQAMFKKKRIENTYKGYAELNTSPCRPSSISVFLQAHSSLLIPN